MSKSLFLLFRVLVIFLSFLQVTNVLGSDSTKPKPFQTHGNCSFYHLTAAPEEIKNNIRKLEKFSTSNLQLKDELDYSNSKNCTIDFSDRGEILGISSSDILGPDIEMPEGGLWLITPAHISEILVVFEHVILGAGGKFDCFRIIKYYENDDSINKEIFNRILTKVIASTKPTQKVNCYIHSFYGSERILEQVENMEKIYKIKPYVQTFGYVYGDFSSTRNNKNLYLPDSIADWNKSKYCYETIDNKKIKDYYFHINMKTRKMLVTHEFPNETDMVLVEQESRGMEINKIKYIYIKIPKLADQKIKALCNKQTIVPPKNHLEIGRYCNILTYDTSKYIIDHNLGNDRARIIHTANIAECVNITLYNPIIAKIAMFHKATYDSMDYFIKDIKDNFKLSSLEVRKLYENSIVILTTMYMSNHLEEVIDYLHNLGVSKCNILIDLKYDEFYLEIEKNINKNYKIFRYYLTDDAIQGSKLKPFKEWEPSVGWSFKTATISTSPFWYYTGAKLLISHKAS